VTTNGITAPNGVTLVGKGAMILNQIITTNNNANVVLSSNQFTNNVGTNVFNTGQYQVWSSDPSLDNRGGLTYQFKQYNATYGITPVQGTGNGFLYSIAPIVSSTLTGNVTKVYDSTIAATLTGVSYGSVTGAIDGDTVTINHPTSGVYDNKNVGVGKNITASGVTVTSATNGAATVYGYQATASGNIGTITPASLTASLTGPIQKVYDGNAIAYVTTNNFHLNNLYTGDSVYLSYPSTGMYDNADVGVNKNVSVSGLSVHGLDANNYLFLSSSVNSNVGVITAVNPPTPPTPPTPPPSIIDAGQIIEQPPYSNNQNNNQNNINNLNQTTIETNLQMNNLWEASNDNEMACSIVVQKDKIILSNKGCSNAFNRQ
jgi:hypothetical protein